MVSVGVSVTGDKVAMVATANKEAQSAGWSAKDVLAAAIPAVSGRGGGKQDVAQGGGSDASGIPAALAAVTRFIGN